jgi:hypothetical protein
VLNKNRITGCAPDFGHPRSSEAPRRTGGVSRGPVGGAAWPGRAWPGTPPPRAPTLAQGGATLGLCWSASISRAAVEVELPILVHMTSDNGALDCGH